MQFLITKNYIILLLVTLILLPHKICAKNNETLYTEKNISIIGAPLDINYKKSIDVIHRGTKIIFDLWKSGKIKPEIGQILPLDKIIPAMQSIENRTALGKIIITTERFSD